MTRAVNTALQSAALISLIQPYFKCNPASLYLQIPTACVRAYCVCVCVCVCVDRGGGASAICTLRKAHHTFQNLYLNVRNKGEMRK